MRAGELRHQVVLRQRSTVQDAAGEPDASWSDFATRRASVERTPGREVWASSERQGRVPVVFRLRYLAGVLPAMRLVHDGKVFDVVSAIDPDGRGEQLLVTTEEHVEETG